MDRQQQGNLLIGAGVLVGLGTVGYWLFKGGWESLTGGEEYGQYSPSSVALPGGAMVSPSAAVTPSLEPAASWIASQATAPSVVEQRIFDRGY